MNQSFTSMPRFGAQLWMASFHQATTNPRSGVHSRNNGCGLRRGIDCPCRDLLRLRSEIEVDELAAHRLIVDVGVVERSGIQIQVTRLGMAHRREQGKA